MRQVISTISLLAVICAMLVGVCCKDKEEIGGKTAMPSRDINTVKEAHVKELMSVPGVVGVYVGELNDHTPCIAVMVVKKTQELEQEIPKVLEGYPVKLDETGEIKPMR